MTETESVTQEGVSPARAARKEAQSLVSTLSELIHGVGGLDQDGKAARLEEARATAQDVVAALDRAVAAV